MYRNARVSYYTPPANYFFGIDDEAIISLPSDVHIM